MSKPQLVLLPLLGSLAGTAEASSRPAKSAELSATIDVARKKVEALFDQLSRDAEVCEEIIEHSDTTWFAREPLLPLTVQVSSGTTFAVGRGICTLEPFQEGTNSMFRAMLVQDVFVPNPSRTDYPCEGDLKLEGRRFFVEDYATQAPTETHPDDRSAVIVQGEVITATCTDDEWTRAVSTEAVWAVALADDLHTKVYFQVSPDSPDGRVVVTRDKKLDSEKRVHSEVPAGVQENLVWLADQQNKASALVGDSQ